MAFYYFMNMERLSMDIIQDHLDRMTETNIGDDDPFMDGPMFENNLKNGYVVVQQLTVLFESFLNSILAYCVKYRGEVLLKSSIDEKLEIIFMHFKKDFAVIKGNNLWSVCRKNSQIRNEFVHYKRNLLGVTGGIPSFSFAKTDIGSYFTRGSLQKVYAAHIALTDLIAAELGLIIDKDVSIFSNTGMGENLHYINPESDDYDYYIFQQIQ